MVGEGACYQTMPACARRTRVPCSSTQQCGLNSAGKTWTKCCANPATSLASPDSASRVACQLPRAVVLARKLQQVGMALHGGAPERYLRAGQCSCFVADLVQSG